MAVYDVVVIGAGIEGSFAAYQSVKNGANTLLLEQFTLPHSRGSSHGQTRIIRKAYDKDFYARMMPESYQIWHEIERESGTKLLITTGMLNVMKIDSGILESVCSSMDKIGSKYEILQPAELRRRYPQFRFDDSYQAVMDKDGGVLMAEKALVVTQDLFKKEGGILLDGEKVVDIKAGNVVEVITPKRRHRASSVIIAAGPWTNKVLSPLGLQLPLKARRIDVMYWRPETDARFMASEGFPTFHSTQAQEDTDHMAVYGVPCQEYPGLIKICSHFGPNIDPDSPHSVTSRAEEHVSNFIRRHMPAVSPQVSVKETCLYTMTPDHDFIIDKIHASSNIIVAAGFSGHGFKLAPVVGKVLAELAAGKKPSYDVTPFTMKRFGISLSRL